MRGEGGNRTVPQTHPLTPELGTKQETALNVAMLSQDADSCGGVPSLFSACAETRATTGAVPLLERLLEWSPAKRMTASEVRGHVRFRFKFCQETWR